MGFDLLSFWCWSASDLVSNVTRGVLAEYLVARALGLGESDVRDEWDKYDLSTPDGTRVEVKSAAYLQSWHQREFSRIAFRVPKTLGWDRQTNRQESEARRQADVYVFALLAHKDQPTLDPLDLEQWEFYVLPTVRLDERERSQHSITLRSLRQLCEKPVDFFGLKLAVERAAAKQKQSI